MVNGEKAAPELMWHLVNGMNITIGRSNEKEYKQNNRPNFE